MRATVGKDRQIAGLPRTGDHRLRQPGSNVRKAASTDGSFFEAAVAMSSTEPTRADRLIPLPENVASMSVSRRSWEGFNLDVISAHCTGRVSHHLCYENHTRVCAVLEEVGSVPSEPRVRPGEPCRLPGVKAIDRSSMNAWDDRPFVEAVKKTGRKRLIFGALYTEICLAFPVVDALAEGYEVSFVVDAVGGLSQVAHRTAIERLAHAGAVPNTSLALVTELFRDWKSPVADKAREIIKPYLAEVQKLAAA